MQKVDPSAEPFRSCWAGLVDDQVRCGGSGNPLNERISESDPTGIRTRVFAVRGRCPWPLDDGAVLRSRESLSEEGRYVKAFYLPARTES